MGWDNPEQRLPVDVTESVLRPVPVADKRGVTAWRVDWPNGLPQRYPEQPLKATPPENMSAGGSGASQSQRRRG